MRGSVRVACIASGDERMRRSMNEIHRSCGIDLLILEEEPSHQSSVPARREPLRSRLKRRLGPVVGRRSPAGEALADDIDVVVVHDASDPRVRAALGGARPDVLVSYNASLLDDAVLASAGTALNVHWGLAPWYRGVYTTAWALLGWDPHGIGVTLHHMSGVVDGGPIVAQVATPPHPGDDYRAIADRQRRAAVELTITCVRRIRDGRPPSAVRQDLRQGRLYRAEQWSPALSSAVVDLLARDGAARMLRRPVRPGPLPLVGLDTP